MVDARSLDHPLQARTRRYSLILSALFALVLPASSLALDASLVADGFSIGFGSAETMRRRRRRTTRAGPPRG